MSNLLTIAPAQISRRLFAEDGITKLIVNNGRPAVVELTDINAAIILALTPTAVGVTISFNALTATVVNATARINRALGDDLVTIRHFSAFARRKPGSTGAIAAQSITFESWNGAAYVEVGRIKVAAAAAGDDPVSDFLDLPKASGDSRFYFQAAHAFKATFESADADIELSLEAYGIDA